MIIDKLGVYIHVPFCASKCYYCDFCSVATRDAQKMQEYTEALCSEIRGFAAKYGDKPACDTLYFGGGTPTLLPVECMTKIVSCVKDCFELCDDAEITVEANPRTADREKLCCLRKLGVNRLSIGMQSALDSELKALGRAHRFSHLESFYTDARESGFENISLDLMYGIPYQTTESFEQSVRTAISLSPEHISSYCLKIEEGTPFYRRKDTLVLPDEDAVSDMYALMCDILSENGYNRYEISNFSRSGRESRHNLKYWEYNDYIGFGPGAHSFVRGERAANSADIDAYISGNIQREREQIGECEAQNEYVMLSMRLSRGVDLRDFEERFGEGEFEPFKRRFEKYVPEFVEMDIFGCRFTDRGMYVSNYILSEVLDF